MNASEIRQKVGKKERESAEVDLRARFDEDWDKWILEPYTYDSHKETVNVTCNNSRTFAEHLHSRLSGAKRAIQVRMSEKEGEDKRDDIAKLERLFDFAFEMGDLRLLRMLQPPLRESAIWFGENRGWMCGRFLVYKEGKNVVFDFLPLDRRWLTYEFDGDGLSWVGYKTFRNKEDLESTYGYKSSGFHLPWTKTSNAIPVIESWDREEYSISCGDDFLENPRRHGLKRIPIVVLPVTIAPPVTSDTETLLKYYGESIYAPNRHISELENKFMSILATQADLLARMPTVNYYKQGGLQLTDTAYRAGKVLNIPEETNKLDKMPTNEISATLLTFVGWISSMRQKGSLSDVEYGQIQQGPWSGTAMESLKQSTSRALGPLERTLGYFYSEACHLIEEQIIESGLKVKIQTELDRKLYETQITPVDLRKPHIVKVKFTARTPWTEMDMYQIADMAKRLGIPDEMVWENILEWDDPKGLSDQAAIEVFEKSPKAAMFRAWVALMKVGRFDEANMIREDMNAMAYQEGLTDKRPGGQNAGQAINTGKTVEAKGTLPLPTG